MIRHISDQNKKNRSILAPIWWLAFKQKWNENIATSQREPKKSIKLGTIHRTAIQHQRIITRLVLQLYSWAKLFYSMPIRIVRMACIQKLPFDIHWVNWCVQIPHNCKVHTNFAEMNWSIYRDKNLCRINAIAAAEERQREKDRDRGET